MGWSGLAAHQSAVPPCAIPADLMMRCLVSGHGALPGICVTRQGRTRYSYEDRDKPRVAFFCRRARWLMMARMAMG